MLLSTPDRNPNGDEDDERLHHPEIAFDASRLTSLDPEIRAI